MSWVKSAQVFVWWLIFCFGNTCTFKIITFCRFVINQSYYRSYINEYALEYFDYITWAVLSVHLVCMSKWIFVKLCCLNHILYNNVCCDFDITSLWDLCCLCALSHMEYAIWFDKILWVHTTSTFLSISINTKNYDERCVCIVL